MPAYLDTIIAAHRASAVGDGRQLDAVLNQVAQAEPVRPFRNAITDEVSRRGMALISEIKRRSPSKGDLDTTLDPASVAGEYENGGAACLSVLTDVDFFGGSVQDLRSARAACSLPVLRKDFTVSPLDVCDARLMGADAVLLIVAALTDTEFDVIPRPGPSMLVDRPGRGARRRRAGAGHRQRRRGDRRQPTGPPDLRGRPPAGPPPG